MASRDDDFLSRWSRRKADARAGLKKKKPDSSVRPVDVTPVVAPAEACSTKVKQAAVSAETEVLTAEMLLQEENEETIPVFLTPAAKNDLEVDDEEVREAFKDVDFDNLDYASDYARFMEKSVPEAIRRRALRMLWGSNPILANIDGLNDYDEDFTDAALAIKIIGSSYRPGSGYLSEEERNAGYSEEARKAGRPDENEDEEGEGLENTEASGGEDLDVFDDEKPAEETPVAEAASDEGSGAQALENSADKPLREDDKA